jgi:hypothetical protein
MIAAVSLATDLGMGQPMDLALKVAVLGVELGLRLGLPARDLSDIYYLALVRHIGCTSDSVEFAGFTGGDDIGMRRRALVWPSAEPPEVLREIVLHVGEGRQRGSSTPEWADSAKRGVGVTIAIRLYSRTSPFGGKARLAAKAPSTYRGPEGIWPWVEGPTTTSLLALPGAKVRTLTKFGLVFLVLLAGAGAASLAPWSAADAADQAVDGNQRLTALTGATLYVLSVAIVVTVLDISGLLAEHYLVGFLLIPPVALKLGSTGYRFLRYYAGSPPYRLAGPPPLLLRFLIAPLLVASTVIVFATGLELWLFGLRYGDAWMTAHTLSAVVMMLAVTAHVVPHLRRSIEATVQAAPAPLRPALSGRSFVLGSLLLGAALAASSLLYTSPFPPSAAGG